jgi:hypothetical protein
MEKTYFGACHCGAVEFEVDVDLEQGTRRCNCTFCAKVRNWVGSTTPDKLRVTKGEDGLGSYSARSGAQHEHCFCTTCGVRVFSRGHIEEMGDFASPMISVLNLSPGELAGLTIVYQDGRHDNWRNPPAEIETRYL